MNEFTEISITDLHTVWYPDTVTFPRRKIREFVSADRSTIRLVLETHEEDGSISFSHVEEFTPEELYSLGAGLASTGAYCMKWLLRNRETE